MIKLISTINNGSDNKSKRTFNNVKLFNMSCFSNEKAE